MSDKNKIEDNLIHIINIEDKTIQAFNNFDLCMFINDKITVKEKKYLFTPNAEAAFYILTKGAHYD
jgi:hypothetical protein|tara:strand:+ start:428 stop:625 length:198 start_codon:yes stop_codon:yes gene_type:complete